MRRKLGKKNKILFVLFSFLILVLIIIFIIGIKLFMNISNKEHNIEEGSILFDKDYNYIVVSENAAIKKSYSGSYKLQMLKDNKTYKYDLGEHSVIYNNSDYKMYVFGSFYQILLTGEVIKMNGKLEIIKNNGPFVYKLKDRKYLIVDKSIQAEDGSIQTKNYLIIEIDRNGNATFTNNEISEKTINPIVLNCSNFIFDIANEKIKISSKEIDLKTVIGSSNLYVAKTDNDGNIIDDIEENIVEEDKTDDYYASYFNKIVNSFNNLTNNLNDKNDSSSGLNNNLNLDLTKWISLSNVTSGINLIKIEYMVFDPNNEYNRVFIEINNKNLSKKQTIQLSKEKNSYIINDLLPDNKYTISLGYALNNNPNEVIYDDVVNIKTSLPKYDLNITKISVNNDVFFTLTADKNYLISKGEVALYVNGEKKDTVTIDTDELAKQNTWTGKFSNVSSWDDIVIKLENLSYNENKLDIDVSSKYVK